MDASEYKRLCAQPDVMRRADIVATTRLIGRDQPELTARLGELLRQPPLPRPSEHTGGAESDHLYLDMDPADVEAVVSALGDREASLSEAESDAASISLASTLLGRWNRAESSRPAV